MSQDRTSWQIKDEAALDELILLMGLRAEDGATLKALAPKAEAYGPTLTKTFYDRLFAHANTAEYLQGVDMQRLHSMVQTWFMGMFAGVYDRDYARQRLHIGEVHVKVGLPVRYPLAMIDVVMSFGDQIANESSEPAVALAAFQKVLSLDIAIFNQAYEDHQLRHLAELVGGERLARRLLTGT
ncbi:protoglobin domain-containing protein [Candidatus Viridilinea mediisalina]|uniref:Globin-coupled histidine kinase n=1 Tax=Candidatus Viridilinea mediisalina TaxID=2024553 RepID=A0A2A6RLC4_9CHLR|nr:protoglobin domain-containing protein [Candidatus Viridilinea mediisalina]PDW03715.1 Globin-coupled histidine kinase [Candidatus Viridilinea mediisalina]